jgi:hypothetical protein
LSRDFGERSGPPQAGLVLADLDSSLADRAREPTR